MLRLVNVLTDDNVWICPPDACELEVDTNSVNRFLRLSDDGRTVKAVKTEQDYPDHPDRFDWPQLQCRRGLIGRCYWEVAFSGEVDVQVSYRAVRRKSVRKAWKSEEADRCWSLRCSKEGYTVWEGCRETPFPSPWTLYTVLSLVLSCIFTRSWHFVSKFGDYIPKKLEEFLVGLVAIFQTLCVIFLLGIVSLLLSCPRLWPFLILAWWSYRCFFPSRGRVAVYVDCPKGTLSFYEVSFNRLTLLHTVHTTFTEPLYAGFRLRSDASSVSL